MTKKLYIILPYTVISILAIILLLVLNTDYTYTSYTCDGHKTVISQKIIYYILGVD